MIPLDRGRSLLVAQLGKPYIFGHEVKLSDLDPKAFDCSEFVQWFYHYFGVTVPDGSYNQFDATKALPGSPSPFDVGFFRKKESGLIFHVFMCYDENLIIHAKNTGSGVVLDPMKYIESHKDKFTGWRRFVDA